MATNVRLSDSDCSLWLHNKLGTSNDSWTSGSICSQLNKEVLRNIKDCFPDLQTQVKLKLLLSFFHIPRRLVEEWRTELEEIIEIAGLDTELWVSMIAETIKTFPNTGSLNTEISDYEETRPIFIDMVNDLRKLINKHSDIGMLPLECQYLNKAALVSVVGQQPAPVKHFTIKKKPKSAALKAELLQKCSDAQSIKKTSAPTIPLRSRGMPRKMTDTTPLKGIPSRVPSSGFRTPTSGHSASRPNLSRTPAGRKDGGIKLLDIAEQPLGYAAAKKRKRQQDLEDQQKRALEAQTTTPPIKTEVTTPVTTTPDYAAGLNATSIYTQPATPAVMISASAIHKDSASTIIQVTAATSESIQPSLVTTTAVISSTLPPTSTTKVINNNNNNNNNIICQTTTDASIPPAVSAVVTIPTSSITTPIISAPNTNQSTPAVIQFIKSEPNIKKEIITIKNEVIKSADVCTTPTNLGPSTLFTSSNSFVVQQQPQTPSQSLQKLTIQPNSTVSTVVSNKIIGATSTNNNNSNNQIVFSMNSIKSESAASTTTTKIIPASIGAVINTIKQEPSRIVHQISPTTIQPASTTTLRIQQHPQVQQQTTIKQQPQLLQVPTSIISSISPQSYATSTLNNPNKRKINIQSVVSSMPSLTALTTTLNRQQQITQTQPQPQLQTLQIPHQIGNTKIVQIKTAPTIQRTQMQNIPPLIPTQQPTILNIRNVSLGSTISSRPQQTIQTNPMQTTNASNVQYITTTTRSNHLQNQTQPQQHQLQGTQIQHVQVQKQPQQIIQQQIVHHQQQQQQQQSQGTTIQLSNAPKYSQVRQSLLEKT